MPDDATVSAESDGAAAPVIVLLVEDSVVLRMPVAHYLRTVGFTVIETGTAQDALDVLASEIRIDVVFSDVQMPGLIDGDGLARKLALDYPTLPVILTSGEARVTLDYPCKAARHFVPKPYEIESIEALIIDVVGRPPAPAP